MPKTLIFAKDDNHAEEIVEIVREVFGQGDDFCREDHLQGGPTRSSCSPASATAPTLRVAVTVDMIATGTDVRAAGMRVLPARRAELRPTSSR